MPCNDVCKHCCRYLSLICGVAYDETRWNMADAPIIHKGKEGDNWKTGSRHWSSAQEQAWITTALLQRAWQCDNYYWMVVNYPDRFLRSVQQKLPCVKKRIICRWARHKRCKIAQNYPLHADRDCWCKWHWWPWQQIPARQCNHLLWQRSSCTKQKSMQDIHAEKYIKRNTNQTCKTTKMCSK